VQLTSVRVTLQETLDAFKVVSGEYRLGLLTLFAVMKDERFFVGAFLEHYRNMGVRQFVVLDDQSIDGTGAFLSQQFDVVVLNWRFAYGEEIIVHDTPWEVRKSRAGVLVRDLLPRKFSHSGWMVNVDADELLILPPGYTALPEFLLRLEGTAIESVSSALVEMYPSRLWDPDAEMRPPSAAELFEHYCYFDTDQNFGYGEHSRSASERLFKTARVTESFSTLSLKRLRRWIFRAVPVSPTHKMPLIKWRDGLFLAGTHRGSVVPTRDLRLAMAHFKFTADLDRRTRLALNLQSYARGSQAYVHYQRLLNRMRVHNTPFLHANSGKYQGPEDFVKSGFMMLPDRLALTS
jgi:hypothetical protein